MGGNSHERSDYEFSTPPDLTGEPESRKQFQTNTAMCRRRLQFERDSEGRKLILSFCKISYNNFDTWNV